MSANLTSPDAFAAQLDGRDATAAELSPLAFAGYAHFTAMQVRGGRVRALDLHLARLRGASLDLFGEALPDERITAYLRAALAASPPDASLTATVYSQEGEFTAPGGEGARLRVLVRTGPPSDGPDGPLDLAVVEYERVAPSVKHVGEIAKTYYLRRAVAEGFDDAAFADRKGRLSEASIWNLAFWDGEAVVWPEAEMLTGTTMGILRRQLDRMGVPQRDRELTVAELPGLAGAVVMNSWTPAVPVRRIGSVAIPAAPDFADILRRAYEAEPLVSP
ncbi:aminotransferase class IV family protein [Yinghuangia sp. YIM S09857]|uniref:aminotransferase class IV family protein n=1 Tax=Yinghuangia sp. YIM S09857 TaxID=3436929 RepID=UPI003F532605